MHWYLLFGGFAVMFLTCGAAFVLGDRPNRLAGMACALAWVLSYVVQVKGDHANPQYGVAAVDVVLLIFLIGLAVTYQRGWLYAAGAFHMLGIATHVAYLVDHRIAAFPYMTAGYLWAYLTLGAMLTGTLQAWQARKLAKTRVRQ